MHYIMNAVCVFVVLLTSVPQGGGDTKPKDAKAEAIKRDLKHMEGTWEIVYRGLQGRQLPLINRAGEGWRHMTILPDGSVQLEGKSKDAPRVKHRLDPTAKPKTIDIVFPPNQAGVQVVTEGIYAIVGDELKLCCASVGNPRPTDFTYARGSGRFLEVYRRVKDKK